MRNVSTNVLSLLIVVYLIYPFSRHSWSGTFESVFVVELRKDHIQVAVAHEPTSAQFEAYKSLHLCESQEQQIRFYCAENNVVPCPDASKMTQLDAAMFFEAHVPIYMKKIQ
jgi:hypothetical protein